MEFQQVVRNRKMVRSFEDRQVPRDLVERILANAQRAPSAGFSQGYAFLVFEGRDETQRFWDAASADGMRSKSGWPDLFNAPLVIVPCAEKDVYLDRYARDDKGWTDRSESHWPVPYWDIDTSMAAMIVLLTAVDLGLGALFFGIFRPIDEFKAAFNIPARVTVIGAIAIGYPMANDRPSPSLKNVGRRPSEQLIHRGVWGRHQG